MRHVTRLHDANPGASERDGNLIWDKSSGRIQIMIIIQLSDPIKVTELGTLDPESGVGHVSTGFYSNPWPRISCTCPGNTKVCPSPTQCMASRRVSPSFIRGKLRLWQRRTRSHESTRCLPLKARSAFGAWTNRSIVKLETVAKPIRDPFSVSIRGGVRGV